MCDDLQLDRDYITLEGRVESEGISFMTVTLPKLGKLFDRALGDGMYSTDSLCGFKASRQSATPRFLGSLFIRVFDKSGQLLANACPTAVRNIRQICYLAYKVDVPYKNELKARVIDSFLNNEEELGRMIWSDAKASAERFNTDPILQVANLCTRDLFPDVERHYVPRHGPGVSSNVSSLDKWEAKLHPGSPAYERFGLLYWMSSDDGMERLHRYPTWSHNDYFKDTSLGAKVLLVPKDSRGPRLISCEPFEHMFVQQGIMRYLYRVFETAELTRNSMYFTDNSEHRRLAQAASRDQEWSTLDLKDASDRVHNGLVSLVFSGTTMLSDLQSCRTTYTVYEQDLPAGFESSRDLRIPLNKFAPMGSGLCFPILAFTCFILIYSALVVSGVDPDRAKNSIKVYGDDIIIRTEYAGLASVVLEAYGLLVNHQKSFINSRFAESCGMDAFDGVCVTPFRLRKLWNYELEKSTKQPGQTAYHLCAFAAQVKPTYPRLAEYSYSLVERMIGRPLPYGLDLSYLCRVVPWTDYSVLQNHYMDRMKYGPKHTVFRVYRVLSRKTKYSETPYGRLQRTLSMLGQELDLPKWGETTLPRDSYIAVRRAEMRCTRYG
jgi:hypothetical protein